MQSLGSRLKNLLVGPAPTRPGPPGLMPDERIAWTGGQDPMVAALVHAPFSILAAAVLYLVLPSVKSLAASTVDAALTGDNQGAAFIGLGLLLSAGSISLLSQALLLPVKAFRMAAATRLVITDRRVFSHPYRPDESAIDIQLQDIAKSSVLPLSTLRIRTKGFGRSHLFGLRQAELAAAAIEEVCGAIPAEDTVELEVFG